jgi:hypothetical protein
LLQASLMPRAPTVFANCSKERTHMVGLNLKEWAGAEEVVRTCNPAHERWRRKNCEFEPSLAYMSKYCH